MDSSYVPDTQHDKSFSGSENRIPNGHIMVNSRWRNTDLVAEVRSKVRLLYDDDLGDIDFRPTNGVCVIYVSESELVSQGVAYKKKIAKQRKANTSKVIVIAERTAMSTQYYPAVQKFCVLELGLVLLPVSSQTAAAGILTQLVHTGNRPENNPFKKQNRPQQEHDSKSLLVTLQCIPGLGSVNAKHLLLHFGSLAAISNASLDTLSQIVGKNIAIRLQNFLT